MEDESIFVCNGKVNLNDYHLSKAGPLMRGELEKVMYTERRQWSEKVTVNLFDKIQPASTAILHLDHLTKCMEMQLRILNRCETYSTGILDPMKSNQVDLHHLRRSICDLILYIRTYLNTIDPEWIIVQHTMLTNLQNDVDKLLNAIRKFLVRLKRIPTSIFHYAVSNNGNKCSQPEFHLYHMHLELRWLIITVIYVRMNKWQITDSLTEDLNRTLEIVVNDLIYISLKIFDRTNLSDLRQRSPYSCTCVRELWLLLQILIDDINDRLKFKSFWDYVNATLDVVLKPKRGNERRFSWHGEDNSSLPESKKPELFCVWLIYHLTLLQGYSKEGSYIGFASSRVQENYEELDRILKSFSNDNTKEGIKDEIDEELKVMIPLLRILTEDWWPSKMLVINYLWECFHRRLEQPFLVQVSGPWSITLEKKSPADILKQVKDRIKGHLDPGNESSYSMFLRFLGAILKKGHEKKDSKYWNQIKGRIYSKFTKSKVQEFNESALINFISLFLTLALTTADASNVCAIMLDLLPAVQEADVENSRRASLSWKGQLSILLVYMENNLHLEPIADKIINVVNVISCRKVELARIMMATFVETLRTILSSSEKLDHGEHHLIGGWIDRYLLECSKSQAAAMLKMLLEVFDKARSISSSSQSSATKMLEALWSVVAGRVRLMVFDTDSTGENYQDVAKLAAAFTIEAVRDPAMAKAHSHSATSLFTLFSSTNSVKDVRITKLYVAMILAKTDVINILKSQVKNFDLMVIQAWLKCCIHGQDANDGEMRRIKTYVSELEDFRMLFPSWIEAHEFKESHESIILYTMALARRRNELHDGQRTALDVRTRAIFNHFDRWVLLPVKEETKDTDLSYWIYRCLGTFFLVCSPIFHTRNQSSPLKNYINKFILPADEQMGFLKQLGKRIFSMVILGLESANARADVQLHNLILEIFQCYLPLLVTGNANSTSAKSFKVSEALIKCFTDAQPEFVSFLLEKLSTRFIKIATDNTMHKHCYLFMVLLSALLNPGNNSPRHVTESIISKSTNNIVESYVKVHDLHPHKKQTADFISDVVNNAQYKQDSRLREIFKNGISTILVNYMTYIPQACFELLRLIARKDVEIVKTIIPRMEQIVVDLEKIRRPNAGSLRYSLKQLQDFVDKIRH